MHGAAESERLLHDSVSLLARAIDGTASGQDYVDWAVCALMAGFDSASLVILAGLDIGSRVSRFDAERYFQQAVRELGLWHPTDESPLRGDPAVKRVQIVADAGNSWIDIKVVDRFSGNAEYQDEAGWTVLIAVSDAGFRGISQELRFADSQIARFISDLEALESRRAGTATLTEYYAGKASDGTPMANEISLFSLDSWGHIAVRARVGRYEWIMESDYRYLPLMTSVAFRVDLCSLPGVVRDLRRAFRLSESTRSPGPG
jgi:hypothetical protein